MNSESQSELPHLFESLSIETCATVEADDNPRQISVSGSKASLQQCELTSEIRPAEALSAEESSKAVQRGEDLSLTSGPIATNTDTEAKPISSITMANGNKGMGGGGGLASLMDKINMIHNSYNLQKINLPTANPTTVDSSLSLNGIPNNTSPKQVVMEGKNSPSPESSNASPKQAVIEGNSNLSPETSPAQSQPLCITVDQAETSPAQSIKSSEGPRPFSRESLKSDISRNSSRAETKVSRHSEPCPTRSSFTTEHSFTAKSPLRRSVFSKQSSITKIEEKQEVQPSVIHNKVPSASDLKSTISKLRAPNQVIQRRHTTEEVSSSPNSVPRKTPLRNSLAPCSEKGPSTVRPKDRTPISSKIEGTACASRKKLPDFTPLTERRGPARTEGTRTPARTPLRTKDNSAVPVFATPSQSTDASRASSAAKTRPKNTPSSPSSKALRRKSNFRKEVHPQPDSSPRDAKETSVTGSGTLLSAKKTRAKSPLPNQHDHKGRASSTIRFRGKENTSAVTNINQSQAATKRGTTRRSSNYHELRGRKDDAHQDKDREKARIKRAASVGVIETSRSPSRKDTQPGHSRRSTQGRGRESFDISDVSTEKITAEEFQDRLKLFKGRSGRSSTGILVQESSFLTDTSGLCAESLDEKYTNGSSYRIIAPGTESPKRSPTSSGRFHNSERSASRRRRDHTCSEEIDAEEIIESNKKTKQKLVKWRQYYEFSKQSAMKHLSSEQSELKLITGRCVHGYRLGRILRTGGSGMVRLCSKKGQLNLAIKIVNYKNSEELESLHSEAGLLKTVSEGCSQYILAFEECIELPEHNIFMIITERMDIDLLDYANSALCPKFAEYPIQRHNIFLDVYDGVLSALVHMHSKGYTHFDIKPENILLGLDLIHPSKKITGTKIADFGHCKYLGPSNKATGVTGTVGYFAAEMVYSKVYDGPMADMYSLGCSVVQISVGQEYYVSYCLEPSSQMIHIYRGIKLEAPDLTSEMMRRIKNKTDEFLPMAMQTFHEQVIPTVLADFPLMKHLVKGTFTLDPEERTDAETLRAEIRQLRKKSS